MSDFKPWLRQAELVIGPLPEYRAAELQNGPSNKKQMLSVYSDGTQDTLRLKFSINLHKIYTAAGSSITVYNLSPELRASINIRFIGVVLRVGWKNLGMKNLFSGSLISAYSRREGADILTTINAVGGYGASGRSYTGAGNNVELSKDRNIWKFTPGTELKFIIQLLAGYMMGVTTLDATLINVPDRVMGYRGLTVFGKIDEILKDLARIYGFTWWIDNNQFHAEIDGKAPVQPAQLLSYKNGTLMRAEPILTGTWQMYAGLSFRALLDPTIRPGKNVVIESSVNSALSGPWCVWDASYTGDLGSNAWYLDGHSSLIATGN